MHQFSNPDQAFSAIPWMSHTGKFRTLQELGRQVSSTPETGCHRRIQAMSAYDLRRKLQARLV